MEGTDHDARLQQAPLPWPLFPVVAEALELATHDALCRAWEALLRVPAAAVWAVAQARGLASPAFDAQRAQLAAPGMGTWVGLLREGARLLALRPDRERAGLSPLLAALDAPLASLPGAAAFRDAARAHAKGLFPADGWKTVLDALGGVVAWRNACEHRIDGAVARPDDAPKVEAAARDAVTPHLAGLLLHAATGLPLVGDARLVLVTARLDDGARRVRAQRLHGPRPAAVELPVDDVAWASLAGGAVYLHGPDDAFVPMAPLAVATRVQDRWWTGWLKELRREVTAVGMLPSGQLGTMRVAVDDAARARLAPPPKPATDAPDAPAGEAPWPGMAAYGEAEAGEFRGREEARRAVLQRLDNERAVVLHGASGSGKSSLLWAAVVPDRRERAEALAAGDYRDDARPLRVVRWSPDDDPLASLRAALRAEPPPSLDAARWNARVDELLPDAAPVTEGDAARAGLSSLLAELAAERRVLLVIDPLEQLWRRDLGEHDPIARATRDAARRRALGLAIHAAARARECGYEAALTVRSDLLDAPMADPAFAPLLDRCGFPLGPMDDGDLRAVIVGPFVARGLAPPSAEFVARVLADARAGSGNLALVAALLRSLWEGGKGFTLDAYAAAGGLGGSVRTLVDAAMRAAPAGVDEAARMRVFRQLVAVSEEGRYLRRPVRLDALAARAGLAEASVRALLDPFVAQRLVLLHAEDAATPGGPAVATVAHESLFTEWSALRDELDRRAEDLRLRDAVEAAATARAKGGALWPADEPRLPLAEGRVAAQRIELSPEGERFLRESRERVTRDRRARRGGVAAIVALAVAALGFGVRATRAQRAAEHSERAAVANRERAEGLVEFMVFDLSARLQPVGRLDLMDAVNRRVDAYFASVRRAGTGLSPRSRQSELAALIQHGEQALAAGQLAQAMTAYEQAKRLTDQLAAEQPQSATWASDRLLVLGHIGDVLIQHDAAGALRAFRESLSIAERLSQADPEDTEARRHLYVGHAKIGEVLMTQGHPEDALGEFRVGLAIMERLARSAPQRAHWQFDLSACHFLIGIALAALGDEWGSLQELHASRSIMQPLAQADPGNVEWQHGMSLLQRGIGDVLMLWGDRAGALQEYRAAHSFSERLARIDSSNVPWQADLAESHGAIALANAQLGRFGEATEASRTALALYRGLADLRPESAVLQLGHAQAQWQLARMLAEERAPGDEARALAETALSTLQHYHRERRLTSEQERVWIPQFERLVAHLHGSPVPVPQVLVFGRPLPPPRR